MYQALDSKGHAITEAESLIALEHSVVEYCYQLELEIEPDVACLVRFDGDDEILLSNEILQHFLKEIRSRCEFYPRVDEDYARHQQEW